MILVVEAYKAKTGGITVKEPQKLAKRLRVMFLLSVATPLLILTGMGILMKRDSVHVSFVYQQLTSTSVDSILLPPTTSNDACVYLTDSIVEVFLSEPTIVKTIVISGYNVENLGKEILCK